MLVSGMLFLTAPRFFADNRSRVFDLELSLVLTLAVSRIQSAKQCRLQLPKHCNSSSNNQRSHQAAKYKLQRPPPHRPRPNPKPYSACAARTHPQGAQYNGGPTW